MTDGAMSKIGEGVKHHPYVTMGLVAGAIIVGLLYSSSSPVPTDTTTNTSVDPALINAELQAQQQTQTLQAQATAHTQDLNAQIQALQIQGGTQVALATLQYHSADTANNYAFQLGTIQSQFQAYAAQLSAGVANNSISTQGAVQLAQVDSNNQIAALNSHTAITITQLNDALQQKIAEFTTTLQTQISHDQTKVALAQTQAVVSIAQINASSSIFGSIFGAIGKIFG